MSVSPDLIFQNFSTVQDNQQKTPVTLASAATVAPQTFLTFITGTVQIATITPPVTGCHMLITIHTDVAPVDYLTSGNILNAVDPAQNLMNFFVFDPIQQKYYGCASNLT